MNAYNGPRAGFALTSAIPAIPWIASIAAGFIALAATGCSPSIVLTVNPDSSGRASFACEPSAAADSVIRRFAGADTPDSKNAPLFDKKSVTVSLAHAGLKVESFETPTKSSLSMGVSFLKLDGLLGKAIVLDRDGHRLTVRLTREILNEALDLMPASTRDYTDLLMAPVFTGETMTASEYEDTIAAAFGKTLSGDLKKSFFTLAIRCPLPVIRTAASAPATAEATGTTVTVKIPLSTLLSTEKPITAFAEW